MYQILLLGTPNITLDDQSSRLANSPKAIALICYLALNGEQRREHVADMLYEATSTAQSLHRLRELLGRIRPKFPPLTTTRTIVSLENSAELTIDLWQLSAAFDSADPQTLDTALQQYRPLLDQFTLRGNPPFSDWLTVERERLHQQVNAAYQTVCEQYQTHQQWEQGIAAAQRWLALNPLHEQAARWLMRLQLGANQIEAAQTTGATLKQRLQIELGVAPNWKTIAVINSLQLSSAWDDDSLPQPQSLPTSSVMSFRRNVDFVGREATLRQIGRTLLDEKRPLILTGIGGIGKTQLAVEVAYRFGRFFDAVYWLNFSDHSSAFDDAAMIGGARGMQLFSDETQLSQREKVAHVQREWQSATRRLLIFDNCTDEQLLLDWVPVTGGASILVTSTCEEWSRVADVNTLLLDVLERDESIRLLQKIAPRLASVDAATLDDISTTVGDLPLALQLAGGYLGRYQSVTPADYVAQLRSEVGLQHPSLHGRGTRLSATRHALSVTHTFGVSYKQLQANDAIDQTALMLLTCIACCAQAEALPISLALRFVSEQDAQTAVDALSRLRELGLVTVKEQQQVVMHRLVAQFVRAQTHIALPNALAQVMDAMRAALKQKKDADNSLIPLPFSAAHLQAIIALGLTHSLPQSAILAGHWSHYLVAVAEVERLTPFVEGAIEAARHETIDNESRVEALRGIAYALRQMGHAAQARQLIEEGLNSRIRIEGELHNGTANSFSDLGIMALQDGEFDEARRLLHKAVSILEQIPSDEREQFAHGYALLHIGLSYISTGEFADGKPYVERGLAIYQTILPDPHAHLASANGMMGHVLAGINEPELALAFFKKAVTQFSAVLGADSFRTAIEQGNVAACLEEMGNISEARQWAATSFTVINERYGDTPQAAFSHFLLGKLALREGQHEEATALLKKSVELYGDELRYAAEKASAEKLLAEVQV